MIELEEIVHVLDEELKIAEIPDYSQAMNGLQLTSGKSVSKVVAAVDASLPVVEKAIEEGADLLFVHHGMFWQGAQMITGGYYKKLKMAMDAGLAIYSAHIPLDVHPTMGNNAILANKLGLRNQSNFHTWKGINLGICGEFDGTLKELKKEVELATGFNAHISSQKENVGKVGVITGGAGSEVVSVFAQDIDTLVTGEGPHWSYTFAQEMDKNIIYGGHYATETFGVKAMTQWLAEKFDLKVSFVDVPTLL